MRANVYDTVRSCIVGPPSARKPSRLCIAGTQQLRENGQPRIKSQDERKKLSWVDHHFNSDPTNPLVVLAYMGLPLQLFGQVR